MKAGNPRRLGIARNPAAREQCLDLRGEAKSPAVVCGVERLDAVGVAGKKEFAPHSIPDGEGEHAAQPVHHRGAVARVEVQKRLRIGGRAEARAGSLEFCAQRLVVVDLAVEGDDNIAVHTRHRLGCAIRQVEDRQPPMPKPAAPAGAPPDARPVGSAGAHRIAGRDQLDLVRRTRRRMVGEDAVYAAHDPSVLLTLLADPLNNLTCKRYI